MKEYRTEEYRLYPDKAQKDAICRKFDSADDAFDALAAVVNALVSDGTAKAGIDAAITDYRFIAPLDHAETRTVRNAVRKLIPKLVSGEIPAILPRNRYRNTKTLDVTATLASSEQVMIDGVGSVQLAFHRPLPEHARVFRVTLKSDCCGERFYLMYSYYFEYNDVAPCPVDPDYVLGIDYKQDGLYVDSDGNSAGYPGFRQMGSEKLFRYRENTKHFKNPYHPAIRFDLYTVLRRGELCALRWKDYSEKTGRITIDETVRRLTNFDAKPDEPKTIMVFNDTKTESSFRELQLPAFLQELIEQQKSTFASKFHIPQQDDFIFFSSNGKMLDPDNLQHHFLRILRKLGLEQLKFHSIRHTFATRAIESGIAVSTVSGLLGHSNVTTTTRFYVHPKEKAMTQAMYNLTPIGHPAETDRLAS